MADCITETTCSGHGACKQDDGSCVCNGNFIDSNCSTCKTDYFGVNCDTCILFKQFVYIFFLYFYYIVLLRQTAVEKELANNQMENATAMEIMVAWTVICACKTSLA